MHTSACKKRDQVVGAAVVRPGVVLADAVRAPGLLLVLRRAGRVRLAGAAPPVRAVRPDTVPETQSSRAAVVMSRWFCMSAAGAGHPPEGQRQRCWPPHADAGHLNAVIANTACTRPQREMSS